MHYVIFVYMRQGGKSEERHTTKMSQARMVKERSEETKEKRSKSLLVRTSCVAECRDFALRDWTEHSADIAKIEACTCPSRKGRIYYASSRSSYSLYSFFVSSFSSSLCLSSLHRCACPIRLRNVSSLFLLCSPPSWFRFGNSFHVVLTASISPCLSLSLSFVFFWAELESFFSPSCVTLLSTLLSIFFSLHAVWL